MPGNCTCGAQLADGARFCHKCGKPQYDYPEPEPILETPAAAEPLPSMPTRPAPVPVRFRLPVAIGISGVAGVGITLMCAVMAQVPLLYPLIGLAGGALAVTAYRALTHVRPTPKNGALVGLMAGLVTLMLFILTFLAAAASFSNNGALAQMIREETRRQGHGAEFEKLLEQVRDPRVQAGAIAGFTIFMFGTIALPSALGGFIGARLGKDQA